MTKFGKFLDKSLKDLTGDALYEVLKDAGCNGNSVEAAFFGNCVQGHMEGQDMVRGEIALRPFGIEGIPVVNVENACATASTAFHMHMKGSTCCSTGIFYINDRDTFYSERA